jgi:hypothetical protein
VRCREHPIALSRPVSIGAISVQVFRRRDPRISLGSGGTGNVTCGATAVSTAERHVRHGWRGVLTGIAFDGAGTRWTAERLAVPITADKVKDLRGVVRIWTRLTHRPSDDPSPIATFQGPG